MKYLFLFTFFMIGKFYPVRCQPNNKGLQPDTMGIQIPKIYLLYFKNGTPFNRDWSRVTKMPIKEEWMQEAGRRVDEFQSAWDQEGPKYLETVFSEFGLKFPYT